MSIEAEQRKIIRLKKADFLAIVETALRADGKLADGETLTDYNTVIASGPTCMDFSVTLALSQEAEQGKGQE